ncbi:hypothetical protein ES708_32778 [subsurface metagenome]
MKIISTDPLCFTVSMKEIEKNNMILSPRYYIEKEKHKEFGNWFKKLSLKYKAMLKAYLEFIKKGV